MRRKDAINETESSSLVTEKCKALISASVLSLIEEVEDEGEDHCYDAKRLDNNVYFS